MPIRTRHPMATLRHPSLRAAAGASCPRRGRGETRDCLRQLQNEIARPRRDVDELRRRSGKPEQ
ncbi:hypothetical protein ACR6C2_20360 [Streptomyces sp. INA 01156]